ncbi:MAG: aspartate kinase [Clostridia bacterium]|nr:aspartate kinase [Clostridia bacterium]
MNIVVQKYGGTSVENKEKLEIVCDKILEYSKKNAKLVVVVSAQGKTTDQLISKASEYSCKPSKRELDLLLMTGELQTVALLTMMLKERGADAIGLTGEQAGIITDSTYGSATIESIYINNILNYLNNNLIVVVAGFQGIDKFGNITTLGRGGSDLTAVALASALKARKCEIYTDVDGVFTADPKIVEKSKLLRKVSYDEMLEAATAGAKVLHNRSVSVGKKHNLKILVKNFKNSKTGSLVEKLSEDEIASNLEETKVKFITKNDNITKISIIGDLLITNKNIVNKIFNIAYEQNAEIYMAAFSELSINLVVDKNKAEDLIKKLHEELIY